MWDIPKFGDIPLDFGKVPSSRLLGLVISGLLNLQKGVSLICLRFCRLCCLMGLKLIPFFFFSSCRMARGHEEPSTSQVGLKRGISREMSTVSSLVVAMSIEELRSFN